eukprot:1017365-Pelagomonas_calceolata.AAC.1
MGTPTSCPAARPKNTAAALLCICAAYSSAVSPTPSLPSPPPASPCVVPVLPLLLLLFPFPAAAGNAPFGVLFVVVEGVWGGARAVLFLLEAWGAEDLAEEDCEESAALRKAPPPAPHASLGAAT